MVVNDRGKRKPSGLYTRRAASYAIPILIVAAATAICLPLRGFLDTFEIALIYLAAAVGIALVVGLWPSIFGAFLAFLAFNSFFVEPYYTYSVRDTSHAIGLLVFLGIVVLVTQLVVRVRLRTTEAIRRGRQTETLYALSVALIAEADLDTMLGAIVDRVREIFSLSTAAVFLLQDGSYRQRAVSGEAIGLEDRGLLRTADWAVEHRQPAALGTRRVKLRPAPTFRQTASRQEVLIIPILTSNDTLGILLLTRDRDQRPFDEEETHLLETFANQAALAIERSLLNQERTRAEVLARTDELKTAMLSAVSHDLRTPLASIKAAATTLLQPGIEWSDEDRRELLETINDEGDRLNHLVTNLLDLSRIESGTLTPKRDWYDLTEVIFDALDRCRPLLGEHRVDVQIPERTTAVHLDFVMISEVLANLIENAAKYSPAGTTITISAELDGGDLTIGVRDEGRGVPVEERERIFDKFYRVEARHRPIGSGMGLAISRGFVEAHGGTIRVEPGPETGSIFVVTLPNVTPDEDALAVLDEGQLAQR